MTKYLIDFDMTLSKTFVAQIDEVNKRFDKNYLYSQFVTWASEDVLESQEVEYMWSEDVFLSEAFQLSCEPLPHAVERVQELLSDGHKGIVVSDRPKSLFTATVKWLEQQGLGDLPVLFTRSIHSKSDQETTIKTKAQIAYLHKLTHVVEDSPHHSIGLAQRSYIDKVYLLDTPNNQHIEHDKITRIYDWRSVE